MLTQSQPQYRCSPTSAAFPLSQADKASYLQHVQDATSKETIATIVQEARDKDAQNELEQGRAKRLQEAKTQAVVKLRSLNSLTSAPRTPNTNASDDGESKSRQNSASLINDAAAKTNNNTDVSSSSASTNGQNNDSTSSSQQDDSAETEGTMTTSAAPSAETPAASKMPFMPQALLALFAAIGAGIAWYIVGVKRKRDNGDDKRTSS
ncbi:MAG: hypothetical protein ACOX4F_08750 [Atopobiaceae bacterium]